MALGDVPTYSSGPVDYGVDETPMGTTSETTRSTGVIFLRGV